MTSTYEAAPYVGEIPPLHFPQRLKLSLDYSGVSQAALARRLGMAPRSVQNWVSGISTPYIPIIRDIARFLAIDEAWLIGNDLPPRLRGRDSNPQPSVLRADRRLAHAA